MLLLQAHVPDACAHAACHLISAIDHTQNTAPAPDATAAQDGLGGPAVTAAAVAVTTATTNTTAGATNHASATEPATRAGGLTDGEQTHDPLGGSLIPLPVGISSVDLTSELAALLMAQQQHTQAMQHPESTKHGRGASNSRSNSSQRTMKLIMQCDNGDTHAGMHSANSTGARTNTTCFAPALHIVTTAAAAKCPAGLQQLHGWEVVELATVTATAAGPADAEPFGRKDGQNQSRGWSDNMHSKNGSTSAGIHDLEAEQSQPAEHYESTWLFMLDLAVSARDSAATAGDAAGPNEDQMVAEAMQDPAAAAAGVQSGAGAQNELWAAGCSDPGSIMWLWLARLLLAAWLVLLQSAARMRTGSLAVSSVLDSYRQRG